MAEATTSTEEPEFDIDPEKAAFFEGVEEIAHAIAQEGHTHGDFMNVQPEELEAAYAQGCMFLNQRQWSKAEEMFKLGAYLDHYDERFWLGLGLARQQNKQYMSAVNAYAVFVNLTPENPIASFRAAECLIAANKPVEAEQALHAALAFCEDTPEHAQIQARAEALLASLS
ncbi:MAG: SycD/LcrH family type III secretion system chaperone [Planctomycetota bacterium]